MNKNKDYGYDWERELVATFKKFGNSKRTPGSGAWGTLTNDASLQGDVTLEVDGFKFLVEAKAGYGGSASITIKREWLDKVTKEANNQSPPRVPLLALKMKNGKTDNSKLVVMALDVFTALLERINQLVLDLDDAYSELAKLKALTK